MITAEDVYEKYIEKSEKNGTNDNFSTSRGKWASLYNELAPRLIKFFVNNRNLDNLKDIQVLLVDDKNLEAGPKDNKSSKFKLPKDFLAWSSERAIASKGKCKQQDISLFEIRDDDRRSIIGDSFFKPSFEYRETPFNYTENFIKVYKEEGMDINNVYLTYYKYPKKIELQDPDNPESSFSQVELELPEHIIDRIVSAMVGDFKISNADPSFQTEKVRQNENIT